MGYFSGITSTSFQRNDKGEILFHPHGNFGKTYILEESKAKEINSFIKKFYATIFVIEVVSVMLFNLYALFLLLVIVPLYVILINRYLKGCTISAEKVKTTYKIRIISMAQNMGLKTSIGLLILSLIMLPLSLYCVIISKELYLTICCGLGCILFGVSLVMDIYFIKYAIKLKRDSKNSSIT